MKKIIFLILFVTTTSWSHAQDVFEKFQNNDGVSYISINPKMFELIGKFSLSAEDPEAQAYLDMVRNIKIFKVLITSDATIGAQIGTMVQKMVDQDAMETLMTVKDADANVAFYVKSGSSDNKVERLLMFSKDIQNMELGKNNAKIENVLLLLEGLIDLDKISLLTEQMDLPGGDKLKKAQQN
jgi:hypothetical protein